MKEILLIATGGTIASRKGEHGLTPQIPAEELLHYVSGIEEFCHVTPLQLMNLDSTNIQITHWRKMAACIEENYEKYDGFVICHGTDTLGYTAAALSYLVQNSSKPIVITGSQKPIDLDSTDARKNLKDSLRFAAEDRAHDVNVVFDGKVICGTRAQKDRTKSYNAFDSINFPEIATIQDQQIYFYIDDKDRKGGDVRFYSQMDPSVGLIKLVPSLDPSMLEAMGKRYKAVIIESFGVGGLPSYEHGDYKKVVGKMMEEKKIVVMTTQVSLEGSEMSIYEVGRSMKEKYGLLEAYDMTLAATFTKLLWILSLEQDPAKIKKLFYTTINRDTLHQDMEG